MKTYKAKYKEKTHENVFFLIIKKRKFTHFFNFFEKFFKEKERMYSILQALEKYTEVFNAIYSPFFCIKIYWKCFFERFRVLWCFEWYKFDAETDMFFLLYRSLPSSFSPLFFSRAPKEGKERQQRQKDPFSCSFELFSLSLTGIYLWTNETLQSKKKEKKLFEKIISSFFLDSQN